MVPFFIAKVAGCVLVAFLYNFYYGFSDAHGYYTSAIEIWNAAKANPLYALELIFLPLENCSKAALSFTYHMNSQNASQVLYMYKIAGFISLFGFGTYMPMALIFTFLAYIGTWKIFLTFTTEFPKHYKKIAIGCLFAPSALAWGGNVMKDPICMFGLGLCFSAFYQLIKGHFKISNIVSLSVGAFLLLVLKNYILIFFCMGAAAAIYNLFLSRIKINVVKKIIRFVFVIGMLLILGLVFYYSGTIETTIASEFKGGYFEAVQSVQSKDGGSTYILPNVTDFSIWGIIRTYILSLNVALFRPYLWEVPNPIAVFNALESTAVMLLSFYLLIKLKIKGFFLFAAENPLLFFSLVFTLALAPLTGFISFNFGTLSRYKIPILPFYYTYIILLYNKVKTVKPGRNF